MSDHKPDDVLWVFKVALSKTGEVYWNDFSTERKKQMRAGIWATINDEKWVKAQLQFNMTLDRSWAYAPILRSLIVRAGFGWIANTAVEEYQN